MKPSIAIAMTLWTLSAMAAERVVLTPGATTLVHCPAVEHVALGNEQIVTVQETLPGTLMISAKQPGSTPLWCLGRGQEHQFEIVVTGIEEGIATQYLVDLVVAEVSQQAARELGLDVGINGEIQLRGVGESRGLNPQFDDAAGLLTLDVFGRLQAAEQRGYANLWSRGTVHIQAGEQTSLHAGGEIPIPGGDTATEFRPYGLRLTLAAESRDLHALTLEVALSLTALDYAVQIDGVPGLTARDLTMRRRFLLGQPVVLARIERGERGQARQGLPHALTAGQQSDALRELWVLVRPRIADAQKPDIPTTTPMQGSRDQMGVYQ